MPSPTQSLHEELRWRGLLFQETDGCEAHLAKGPATGYCGFDPTAESLHVGNLVSLLGLVRLARAGHRAVALVGGGTAMIGDPSGKSEERPMRTAAEISANAKMIEAQIRRVATNALGAEAASRFVMRDNAEWLAKADLIGFLRDTGKHFTVNWMMQKDSVKSRMETGISFTEFSYMLLQAHDFAQMHAKDGVSLQLGGSDQWGNITAGTELIRRTSRGSTAGEAHGLTFPLLTDSAGKKFGKTEAGAVYLDAALTSVYKFYQFWINTEDADVGRLLRTFTFMSRAEIELVEGDHAKAPHERGAQRRLAVEVTTLVHGAEAAKAAERASSIVFDKKVDPVSLTDAMFEMLASEMPSLRLQRGALPELADVLAQAFDVSKTAARKLVQQGAVSVNGVKLAATETALPAETAVRNRWLLVRKGAKEIAVVELSR
jgi:tyrosyl-tRNA synthetase